MSAGNKVGNLVIGVIGAVIVLAVGIALGPTVTQYLGYVNTSSMENVSMGAILALLAGYGSFFYYFGLVMGALLSFWAVTKAEA